MPPSLPIFWSDRYSSDGHHFTFFYCLHKRATILNLILTIIGLLAAFAGIICLFRGSFSENQFKDAVELKIAVFTILAPLVVVFLFKARKCNDVLEKVCRKHIHMKSLVKLVILGCATTVNLLIKYPRFNVHSKYEKCSQGKEISQGSRFNLYSAGSFSAFALVMSSKRTKDMELGIFDFLLGLTMDASMEIPGNEGPNLLYMLGAYMYCALLVVIRSHLESLMLNRNISGARQGNIQDLRMVLVEGAREAATAEIGNFVIDHPDTEVCEETIGLSPITMPVLRGIDMLDLLDLTRNGRDSTSLLPDWKKGRQMSTSRVEEEEYFVGTFHLFQRRSKMSLTARVCEDLDHLRLLYVLPTKSLYTSLFVQIDLTLSEFLCLFGDAVIDGVKLVSEFFYEDRQNNHARTNLGDRNTVEIKSECGEEQRCELRELSGLGRREDTHLSRLRRRRNVVSKRPPYHGDVVKGCGVQESDIPYDGWQKNGGSTSVSESIIVATESRQGAEQRDEIDGGFLDVESSEDRHPPDGMRKRKISNGMKLEIRNVLPGVVKDRLPYLQELHVRDDYYWY